MMDFMQNLVSAMHRCRGTYRRLPNPISETDRREADAALARLRLLEKETGKTPQRLILEMLEARNA